MTAFTRYKKHVLKKSIIISLAVGLSFSLLFALALPLIEKSIPNADRETEPTAVIQEVENE